MKKITIEVNGKKHKLVKDPNGDSFFGCKLCSLIDICVPSKLLCDELGRSDSHFELDIEEL